MQRLKRNVVGVEKMQVLRLRCASLRMTLLGWAEKTGNGNCNDDGDCSDDGGSRIARMPHFLQKRKEWGTWFG